MISSNATIPSGAPSSRDAQGWRHVLERSNSHPTTPWTPDEIASLADFNRHVGGGEATQANIERLSDPRTLVAIAGQQAGLFLSPLYILYKAIAAIEWARRLSSLLERPVVPAFWIASEDHDFAEIARFHYLDKEGKAVTWTYPRDEKDADRIAGRAVYDVPMDKRILSELFDQLTDTTRPTEFRDAEIERWCLHIRDSEGFEDLFAHGMMDCLGSHGIVLISPRLDPIRRRAAAIVRREIEQPGRSTRIVMEAGESFVSRGERTPLHRRGDETNFFLDRSGIRCKVAFSENRFHVSHPISGERVESLDSDSLLSELAEFPSRFSPNAILRPIVQDAALPVVATLAGLAESRYLAQIRGVYDFFGIPASEIVSRPHAILIEPRIERLLERYVVAREVLARQDWPALEESVLRASPQGEGLDAIARVRESLEESLEEVRARLGDLANRPSLVSALEKSRTAIETALDRLESRTKDEMRREQESTGMHLARIFDSLRPNGEPQERVFSPFVPFLFNYGRSFLDWLMDRLDPDEHSMQMLYLSSIQQRDSL